MFKLLTVKLNLKLPYFTSTSCTERGCATHSMLSSWRISSSMCCRASSFAKRFGWTCFCTWIMETNTKKKHEWPIQWDGLREASCNLKTSKKRWKPKSPPHPPPLFRSKRKTKQKTLLHSSNVFNWKTAICKSDRNTWYDARQLGSGHIKWRQNSKYRQWLNTSWS